MKNKFILIVFYVLPVQLLAQPNLVPNPSFEIFVTCPFAAAQINYAAPWFQPNTLGSSTEYFNACSINPQIGVPQNGLGFQHAKSGVAYVGILAYTIPSDNYREYLEVQLSDSLVQGEEYCVSFYVVNSNKTKNGIDAIGAFLSVDSILYNDPDYNVLPFIPQVENTPGNIISDTLNWVLIKNSFIASGGEKFITIGNFKDNNSTNVAIINAQAPGLGTYYYIDNISVIQGTCAVEIEEINRKDKELVAYPNPTPGIVKLKNVNEAFVEIMDAEGRVALKGYYNDHLNLTFLENGIYLLKTTLPDKKTRYGKVVLCK